MKEGLGGSAEKKDFDDRDVMREESLQAIRRGTVFRNDAECAQRTRLQNTGTGAALPRAKGRRDLG